MIRPQPGIFTEGTTSHRHLELRVNEHATDAAVAEALAATRAANALRRTNGGIALVIGFGPELAARLLHDQVPPLESFGGYRSPGGAHEAPATQHDLWIWVHGPQRDGLVDVVRRVVRAWKGLATIELDVDGFVYRDSRDLTGFVDGTANLPLEDAPGETLIPPREPGEGGCCAMTMQFTHDLDGLAALSDQDQAHVIGRTRDHDRELSDDEMPDDAHVARVEIEDEQGEELSVYRRSVPWATATSQGLQFVAFGADVARFDLQLRRMYGLDDDARTDRLLDFTKAGSGSFWFCPSVDQLESLAP